MINVGIISFILSFIIISFCIGYIKGFKKAKAIDDEILRKISSKYKE